MAVLFCGRCIQMVADRCRYSSIVGLCIYMLLLWNMFRGLSGKQHTWSSCSFLPNLIVSLLYRIFPSSLKLHAHYLSQQSKDFHQGFQFESCMHSRTFYLILTLLAQYYLVRSWLDTISTSNQRKMVDTM